MLSGVKQQRLYALKMVTSLINAVLKHRLK